MGTKVTNVSNGPRGIRNDAGSVITMEAGETADIDLAKGEEPGEWFKFGAKGKKADAPTADDIKSAIEMLDKNNNEHWTEAGLPSVDAMKEALGAEVTRKQIEDAAPDAKRPTE